MCSPLIGIQHNCTMQLAGAKRLFLLYTRDLENDFLSYELAMSDGVYEGGIPIKAGKGIVEIEAWYDTLKVDNEMKSGAGFSHALEFSYLGYEADVVRLIATLKDYPCNAIVEGNDGRRYWLGQKHTPLLFDVKAVMPEKGTQRKTVTFTAKREGMTVPPFPLGELYFSWLPDWSFEEYLALVNREFDLSFEMAFG